MISLSNTLDKTGSIEMGRQSSSVVGLSILGMTHFHSVGNTDNLMHSLIIYVSSQAIFSATNFTKLTGILSLPVEQSLRILFTSCRVSLQDAVRNLKLDLFTNEGDMLLMIYFNTCKPALFLPIKFIWVDSNALTIWVENVVNNFQNFTRFFTR